MLRIQSLTILHGFLPSVIRETYLCISWQLVILAPSRKCKVVVVAHPAVGPGVGGMAAKSNQQS